MKQLILLLLFFGIIAPRSVCQQVRRDTLVVHFPFDRYDTAIGGLDDSAILEGRFDSICISGHTDLHGSENYNQTLSFRRAQFVKLQFGRLHPAWPTTLYRIAAMGKTQPVSPIDSLNRRVVVIFYSHPATSLSPPHPQLAGRPDTSGHPTNIDTVFTLTQIYFIENTPLFTEASKQALPSVMSYLKKYRNRTMRVLGYVNSPGELLEKNDHLFVLSVKRAQAVYSYMLSDGFDSRRLTYQGMGNSVMVKPHPMSLAEMRENMRVVIEVDKE